MKLPANVFIAESKLTRYLLVPQPKDDKSAFLASAGYVMETAEALRADLFRLAETGDAVALEVTVHGKYWAVDGTLMGSLGRELTVRTIWMTEHLSGVTKFITLIPKKRSP